MLARIPLVFLTILLGLSAGCSSDPPESLDYDAHDTRSYLIRGRNRTFAIYNGEHRLISHPIEDLLAEMKYRKTVPTERPITDVYVVSHGWNYTAQAAVANDHNYMQMVDRLLNDLDWEPPLLKRLAPKMASPATTPQ